MQLKVEKWEAGVACFIGLLIAGLMLYATIKTPLEPATEVADATVKEVGVGLLSRYMVPFEVAAVLLLVVMIGAAYMARRREEGDES